MPTSNPISFYLTRQFLLFLLAGGFAAIANFGSRFIFEQFLTFTGAVVASYAVGLTIAFVLNKHYVFRASTRPLREEIAWFLFFNLLAFPVTLGGSLLLHNYVFSLILPQGLSKALAHAIAIALPALLNFVAHKFITFKNDES